MCLKMLSPQFKLVGNGPLLRRDLEGPFDDIDTTFNGFAMRVVRSWESLEPFGELGANFEGLLSGRVGSSTLLIEVIISAIDQAGRSTSFYTVMFVNEEGQHFCQYAAKRPYITSPPYFPSFIMVGSGPLNLGSLVGSWITSRAGANCEMFVSLIIFPNRQVVR